MVNVNSIFSTISLFAYLFLSWMVLAGCKDSSSSTDKMQTPVSYELVMEDSLVMPFPYDFSSPDQKIELPRYLQEISGLSYVKNNQLAMLHDEAGSLFILDIDSSKIVNRYTFKRKGDFEGVEIVEDTAYMLRSDGTIYEIKGYAEAEPQVTKYETALTSDDDTEGLGYDPSSNSLLIACKEPTSINGKELRQHRGVHTFNLQTHQLSRKPFVLVDLGEIAAFLTAHIEDENMQDLAVDFSPSSKSSFKPSGVAIHPLTGYIYMIASNGELLVVLNKEFKVVQVQHLARRIFSQPEGICFSPSGELFISNEGRNKAGNILKFSYHPNP